MLFNWNWLGNYSTIRRNLQQQKSTWWFAIIHWCKKHSLQKCALWHRHSAKMLISLSIYSRLIKLWKCIGHQQTAIWSSSYINPITIWQFSCHGISYENAIWNFINYTINLTLFNCSTIFDIHIQYGSRYSYSIWITHDRLYVTNRKFHIYRWNCETTFLSY